MTNTERAFLRAICEQPDEDTPRLVFADYLDEQGGEVNALWAELIRVQVPLARGAGAERERLVARERELEPALVAVWASRLDLPFGLRWENWVRGFPLRVTGPGEAIRSALPAFANRVPFREFHVRAAADADLITLAAWPEAHLVRRLALWTEYARLSERAILALAGSKYLRNLERLQMQWVGYTDRGMDAFLESPHLSGLADVKIVGYDFSQLSEDVRQRVHGRFGRWSIS